MFMFVSLKVSLIVTRKYILNWIYIVIVDIFITAAGILMLQKTQQ